MQLQEHHDNDSVTTLVPSDKVVGAWARLVRTEQRILARVEEDLKRAGFPPLEWYDVLYELDREPTGTLAQAEVQARVLLAQYNLCRLVDRLQRENLVERRPSPEDGRSNLLVITPKGRALRKSIWPAYATAIQTHLGSRITCDEARQLSGLLDKLLAG